MLLFTERHQDEWMEEEVQRLEAEHSRLSDQLITAEQEERRRLALFLHDGPVQSMSGIALMLDGVIDAVEADRTDEAKQVLSSALEKQRQTIRSLRDLSFELEPVVLRDQGFSPAVRALAEQLGMSNSIQIDLDVDAAESLTEHAQVAVFQIIREALHQAIRRGPPTRMSVRVGEAAGGIEAVISDDAPGERRRASYDEIAERARSLNGRLSVDRGPSGGTAVRIVFPAYRVRR
jgi:signal transduction histidine kinase